MPSFPPSPAPAEIGGGVVIPYFYTLVVEDLDKTIEMLLVLSTHSLSYKLLIICVGPLDKTTKTKAPCNSRCDTLPERQSNVFFF